MCGLVTLSLFMDLSLCATLSLAFKFSSSPRGQVLLNIMLQMEKKSYKIIQDSIACWGLSKTEILCNSSLPPYND